jgi:hypothetical protein
VCVVERIERKAFVNVNETEVDVLDDERDNDLINFFKLFNWHNTTKQHVLARESRVLKSLPKNQRIPIITV